MVRHFLILKKWINEWMNVFESPDLERHAYGEVISRSTAVKGQGH